MATQDEIIQLRDELKKFQQQTKKSRTRAVVGFVLMVLVMLMSFVYAFVKNVEAIKNAEEANRQRNFAEQSQRMAEANAMEAQRQEAMATEQQRMAEEVNAKLNSDLEKCRKSKK